MTDNPTTPLPVQEPAGAVEAQREAQREFSEWLDSKRNFSVSEVFHDIVANFNWGCATVGAHASLASLQTITQAKPDVSIHGPGMNASGEPVDSANVTQAKSEAAWWTFKSITGGQVFYEGPARPEGAPERAEPLYAAPQEAVERQPLTDAQIDLGFESWADDYPVQIVGYLHDYCSDAFRAGIELAHPSVHGIAPATQEKQHG